MVILKTLKKSWIMERRSCNLAEVSHLLDSFIFIVSAAKQGTGSHRQKELIPSQTKLMSSLGYYFIVCHGLLYSRVKSPRVSCVSIFFGIPVEQGIDLGSFKYYVMA